MTENNFILSLQKINIIPTNYQLEQLKKYYELLIEWNEKVNLTAITDKDLVYLKHFYDSAALSRIIDLNTDIKICDVGSGAGFPGIVLKILFPSLNVTLVDALNKRITFLNFVIDSLKLENIVAVHDRIEEYALKNQNKFDLVTARAVAPLNILLEYCIPLVKVNSFFIPMKANISQEIIMCDNVLKVLDIKIIDKMEFDLPYDGGHRTLIKFTKNSKKIGYPRKNADIKKKPL